MAMAGAAEPAGFRHAALLYRSDAEYAQAVMDMTGADGADASCAALVATGPRDGLVRDAARVTASAVSFADITKLGRDPARLIPAALAFAGQRPGRRACCVLEAGWPGRSPAELRELGRYEALCNLALAGQPVTLVCPYDCTQLPAEVLASVELTHPVVIVAGQSRPGHGYLGPGRFPPGCDQPLPDPPPDAAEMTFTSDLSQVRAFTARHAEAARLPQPRAADLVIAASELAANTVQHSPGGGTVSAWHTPYEALVQVTDSGTITDPLTGYRQPPSDTASGHGLWLVRQVCDLTELRTGPAGTTIRLHMSLGHR